jgi:hypothetical protein
MATNSLVDETLLFCPRFDSRSTHPGLVLSPLVYYVPVVASADIVRQLPNFPFSATVEGNTYGFLCELQEFSSLFAEKGRKN